MAVMRSFGLFHPARRNRPKPTLGSTVRYWNSLPDTKRYGRARKFGRVPIKPARLKRAGYKVEEDYSISRRRR